MKMITLPKGSGDPLPELAAYLEPFAPLFRRSTSRSSLERYVTGLLTDLPRKNCEVMAQAVANTSLEQLRHLFSVPNNSCPHCPSSLALSSSRTPQNTD